MKKNLSIEFLRFIATIGVVLNHVCVCWPSFYGMESSDKSNLIFNSLLSCAFYAVPIFMMITGYLLMQKENVTYKTAWKYFKRIAIILIIFGTVFAAMELFFKERTLNVHILIASLGNMIEGKSWKHLWYLYMLLGIYAIYPWLSALRATPPIKENTIKILCISIFLFESIIPSFHITVGIEFPINSIYVGYFLVGYILFLEHEKLNRMLSISLSTTLLLITFAINVISTIFYNTYEIKNGVVLRGYISPVTIIQALLIFHIITYKAGMFDKICNSWLIKHFNKCSLGIYIIHMFWINLIIKVGHVNIMQYNGWLIIPMVILIFLISWISVEGLFKIPILKKIL